MKKLITLIMFFTAVVYSQTTDNEDVNDKDIEEVVIKGNVLYSDQVNCFKNSCASFRCTSNGINYY